MSDKDPFGEHTPVRSRGRFHILGAPFEFTSDDARLLRLAEAAYAHLPRHRLAASRAVFRIHLQLTDGHAFMGREPPELRTHSDGRFLCGIVDAANFAVISPVLRRGLVGISRELLRFPYHARYELLEFAVFTLVSRAQGLAPLHAGCVGLDGAGVLLIGESGAGKSTLVFQAMLAGMDVLAEDAVFVAPDSLRATGVANYLHLRADVLRFIDHPAIAARVRRSPTIRRRSGVEKFEIDLRRKGFRCASSALKVAAVVFLTAQRAPARALLRPLEPAEFRVRFAAGQPYAASLPSGRQLMRQLAHVGAFELRRAAHPREAAQALRGLLLWGRQRR